MEKTTNIIIEEVKENIYKILTESRLPASIVSLIMKDINNDVQQQAKIIVEQEKIQYQNSLKKETENN